jgi:uncharacterized repeat protein (TIGR02543 family)
MKIRDMRNLVWLLLFAVSLAACGGGGGGGAPASAPTPAPTFTVTYNANTGSGNVPIDPNTYQQGQVATVLGSSTLSKTGYSFAVWNTKADGTGASYNPGPTFTMGTSNVILYAQWTANPVATYAVTYSGNGSTSGSPSVDNNTYQAGQTVTVLGSGTLVKTPGWHFAGWSPSATGAYPSPTYAVGQTFTMGTSNVTLYAQWSCIYESPGETELDGCDIQISTGNPSWCPGITTSDSNCWLCINSGNNYDLSVLRYDNSTSRVDITDWSANIPSSDKIWYWTFQSDGNLVVYCYNSSNQAYPCWTSNTSGHPGASLVLYENYPISATARGCGFFIYDANGTPLLELP